MNADFSVTAAAAANAAAATPGPAPARRAAISWSAGKDSWLAWLVAREQGHAVPSFFTMCHPDGRSLSHEIPPAWLARQVAALGGQWRPVTVPPGGYAAAFDAELQALAASGHDAVVFGDIDLQAHRDWLAPACERAGLRALFPLWGRPRAALAAEQIARGVQARVICVDERWLDASFCGVAYDAAFLARLPAGVCPCGEDGEFHTLVHGGPGFSAPLTLPDAPLERVASRPPYAPTHHVFQRLDGLALPGLNPGAPA